VGRVLEGSKARGNGVDINGVGELWAK